MKRQVLGGCEYQVRYLTMRLPELRHCLTTARLLPDHHIRHLTSALLHTQYDIRYKSHTLLWRWFNMIQFSKRCPEFPVSVRTSRLHRKFSILPSKMFQKTAIDGKLVSRIFVILAEVFDWEQWPAASCENHGETGSILLSFYVQLEAWWNINLNIRIF